MEKRSHVCINQLISIFSVPMSLLQRERQASILIDPCIHEITWVHIAASKNALKLWKVFAENFMPFVFAAWTSRYIKNKKEGKITCTCWKQLYFNKLHFTRFVWIVACRIILFWVGGCCFVKMPINTFLGFHYVKWVMILFFLTIRYFFFIH